MPLRKTATRPPELQDKVAYGKKSNDPTEPAFPHLLQSQIVPYNQYLPPAAFPSLPFPTEDNGEGDAGAAAPTIADTNASPESQSKTRLKVRSGKQADRHVDDYEMSDDESFPAASHPSARPLLTLKFSLDAPFEEGLASSDEDDGSVPNVENGSQPPDILGVDSTHCIPQVRMHVFRVLRSILGSRNIF